VRDFNQVVETLARVMDCAPHQKSVALDYCNRLVDKYLKGTDKLMMMSIMLVHMKYALKEHRRDYMIKSCVDDILSEPSKKYTEDIGSIISI
jgi:hypothetical protein